MDTIEKMVRNDLNQYIGEYEPFIDSITDIIAMLQTLLKLEISLDERKLVLGALAYFVAPIKDIMPRGQYGAYGYIPYLYIGAFVLKCIDYSRIPHLGLPNKTPDLEYIIDKCHEALTDEECMRLMEYIGAW